MSLPMKAWKMNFMETAKKTNSSQEIKSYSPCVFFFRSVFHNSEFNLNFDDKNVLRQRVHGWNS